MTPDETTAFEDRLAAMSDAEVLRRVQAAPLESDELELLLGECERRNLDL